VPDQDKLESPQRIHLFGYAALCLIWGSTWLAIRVVVGSVPPIEAAAIRFFIAAGLLLLIAVVQKRPWPKHHHEWDALIVLGFTIMAVPYGLLFWAEQYVTSSMTAVLFSSMPLFVALLTPLMTHARVPRQAVLSMVVAFGGLLVLFYSGLGSASRGFLGGLAILAAVILSAWSVIYAKRRLYGVDAVVSTALQLAFGAIALLWGTWALESRRHALWTKSAVFSLTFLVVFGSCAAFVIYYWLLKRMQPYQLSSISLIVPVVALLEGALILREPVRLMTLLAILIVLGSVATVLRASPEPARKGGRVLNIKEDTAKDLKGPS
jgi:drug/metabolite transporter (DMT)-like permease